MKNASCPKRR
jgi:hypothetical protein